MEVYLGILHVFTMYLCLMLLIRKAQQLLGRVSEILLSKSHPEAQARALQETCLGEASTTAQAGERCSYPRGQFSKEERGSAKLGHIPNPDEK